MENVKTGPFRKLKYQLNSAAQYLKLNDRGIFFQFICFTEEIMKPTYVDAFCYSIKQ